MNNRSKAQIDARRIAYNALIEFMNGAYSNLCINDELNKNRGLEQRDRAFASTLFYSCIENKLSMDYYISKYVSKSPPRQIKCVLYIGICQILYMDFSGHAAINESVELCKNIGKEHSAGFVNAILRKILDSKHCLPVPDGDIIDKMSIEYSYPREFIEMLVEDFSLNRAEEIIKNYKKKSIFCIRPNHIKFSSHKLENYLKDNGIVYKKGEWNDRAFYVEETNKILSSELYIDGEIAIQGESSMIVGEIASIPGAKDILDACAAPGGKSAYIADRLPNASIKAWDIHEHRVELIKKNCARLGIKNVNAHVYDSSKFNAEFKEKFDIVLVDVPCSGSGVVRNKPDIKYGISRGVISELVKLQSEILWNCSKYVKLGGHIIYSTCSILSAEDEKLIENFLKNNNKFALDEIDMTIPKECEEALLSKGEIKLYPPRDGVDGFYMAKLIRVK